MEQSLREAARSPLLLVARTSTLIALLVSSLALLWAATGTVEPVHLPFVYPMRQASALCVSILAGALLATCAGRHGISKSWSFVTAVVALLSLLGLALRWADVDGSHEAIPRVFSYLTTALPNGVSFLMGGAAVWAVAADRPSSYRIIFAAIAATIAGTLGLCGLLNGLLGLLPANAAFEGELAVDATFCGALIGIAILCVAMVRSRDGSYKIHFITPLLVAAIGTIGSFLMWRFLLEERSTAIAFQTSNAANTVHRALNSEMRQLVRQLRHTADEPDATVFQETEMQPEVQVVWTDSKTLAAEEKYLADAVSGRDYGIAQRRVGAPELVVSAPKRNGGLRIAAFPAHGFFDPILTSVLGSNFNLSLVQDSDTIYRYPPSRPKEDRLAAEVSIDVPELKSEIRLEPRSDFVRRGGTGSLHLALVMGLIATFLLATSVHLLHASRATLAAVQEARAGLELEVEQRRHAEEELDRQAKQLQASNSELQEFAHVVSHDLQEPLRSIRGFAQLIGRRYSKELDADGHEFLQFISDSSTRMNGMIQGLLAYSRLTHVDESGEVVPLGEAVDWARSNLAMAVEECGASIHVSELPKVKGNRLQLCQLMQNLIGNALKYRGTEKPVIQVSSRKQGSDHLVIVSDNGLGIGPEFQHRIFGLFKRAHGNDYPGAGVGLALCKKIVERHGGQIWVESSLGRGSQFFIRLPEMRPDSRPVTRELRRIITETASNSGAGD